MITHSAIQLYKRKQIKWLSDVESPQEGVISHISTLEDSLIVSPTIEATFLQYELCSVLIDRNHSNSFEPRGTLSTEFGSTVAVSTMKSVPTLPSGEHRSCSHSHKRNHSHYHRYSRSSNKSSRSRSRSQSHYHSSSHHHSSHHRQS